ncbi:NmrA family NAD(P)-binding protein [Rodentibacter haemolyticus]|uniref:NAD(P)H-binding protein n=1 Tax=Rodentibacter haemolyticus TaxID=2778911 RepID=A0ABX6UXH4_9PAST|nr:NAD(P)H-binding protein [Rodentibacter haemolyticus]QPB41906.1 NAD(P)H-binding protein [Rodentibacter haemolyticus]
MSKILITGAGGAVGSVSDLIIKHLVEKGHDVRAFMRPTNKKDKDIAAMGVEVFKGDLLNLHDVAKAVEGVDIVYFSMSLNPYYADAYIIMMEACRRQGNIKALINLSEYEQTFMGYDEMVQEPTARTMFLGGGVSDWSPQQRAHWVSERALEWSDLPYVNIHANVFVENPIFSWFSLGTIVQERAFEVPFNDEKMAPISAPDLAEAVANIMDNVEVHISKSYALTGDELVSMADLAQMYSDIFGFEVQYRYLDKDQWAEKYLGILRDNNQLHTEAHLKQLLKLLTSPKYNSHTTDTLATLLGHKPKGIRYALENLPRIVEIKQQLAG